MPALADPVRFLRVLQIVELHLRHMHRADRRQVHDPLQMRPVAADRGPQRRDVAPRRRRRLRARRDERRPAARLQHGERLLRDLAADRIEHAIDARHGLAEILRAIVDDLVRAELANIVVVGSTRRRDHPRADMLGGLDRKSRHAAGAAMDQDRLALLQLQRVLDRDQRRQPDQRERRRIHVGYAVRLPGEYRCCRRDLLAVRPLLIPWQHAEHRVTDLEVRDALTDSADQTGDVAAENVRERRHRAISAAGPDLPVRAVDAGGVNIDDHLARLGNRIWQLAIGQNLRPAVLLDVDCFHDRLSPMARPRQPRILPVTSSTSGRAS